MKHTEGTWIANDGQIYPVETGKTLALIPHYDEDNEEQQANAKLIAAAPDLLHALKKLLRSHYRLDSDINPKHVEIIAQDAINKATEP